MTGISESVKSFDIKAILMFVGISILVYFILSKVFKREAVIYGNDGVTKEGTFVLQTKLANPFKKDAPPNPATATPPANATGN